jgi:hypothetical protein
VKNVSIIGTETDKNCEINDTLSKMKRITQRALKNAMKEMI